MKRLLLPCLLGIALAAAGCSRAKPAPPAPAADQPPHGGTAVQLGNLYFLELVRDPAEGRMEAYLLDSEMENFIRISDFSFEVVAVVGGQKRALRFTAVANPATGETVGQTSEFTASAPWLKTADRFEGILQQIDVRGHLYTSVAFPFPEGKRNPE